MNSTTQSSKFPQIFWIFAAAVLGYGAASVSSRTLMDSFAWVLVLFTLASLPVLFRKGEKAGAKALWPLRVGVSYFVFTLLRLLVLPRVDLPHLVFVDVFFVLVPLVIFTPALRNLLQERKGDFDRLLEKTAYALAAMHVFSLLYSVHQVFILNLNGARGFLGITILMAYNHLFSLTLVLTLLRYRVRFGKFGEKQFFALSFVVLANILLSFSRTASVVGISCWALVVLPWAWKRSGAKVVVAILLLIVAGLGGLYKFNPTFRAKYSQVVDKVIDGKGFKSLRARQFLWAHNQRLFWSNPVSGVGYRQNIVRPKKDYPAEFLGVFGRKSADHLAHNLFLQALVEGGLVGFSLLMLTLFYLWRRTPGSGLLFLSLLTAGLSDTPLSNPKMFHSFYFALLFLGILGLIRPHWTKTSSI